VGQVSPVSMLLQRFDIGQYIGEKTSKWNTVQIRGNRGWALAEKRRGALPAAGTVSLVT
jgi:hypothetical protein